MGAPHRISARTGFAVYLLIYVFIYCFPKKKALPGLHIDPGAFALIGAASLLGGITRMTLALTVILIESTANTSFGLPLMMSLLMAKWVGDMFNHGILEIAIEAKAKTGVWCRFYFSRLFFQGIPLLGWDAPFTFRKFKARHVMRANPVCLPVVVSLQQVVEILRSNDHNGFPVINARGQFIGLILRSQVISMIAVRERSFCFRRGKFDFPSFFQGESVSSWRSNWCSQSLSPSSVGRFSCRLSEISLDSRSFGERSDN